MQPTTTGRFRVHERRPRPDVGGDQDRDGAHVGTEHSGDDRTDARASEEFVLVELPEEPVDPTDPNAEDAYDPLYVSAEGYSGEFAERVASLDPGTVVDATLAWDDGTARFSGITVVREDRFRFADGVEGMFEAAVEGWRRIRADGESIGSVTTRSNDGEPNGALYLFADAPGTDVFAEIRAGRLPIEPLIARVNDRRDDGRPREVFVLRPAAHEFVAVHVVFDRGGVLARTIRDTYDLGDGLAAGLGSAATRAGPGSDGADHNPDGDDDGGVDSLEGDEDTPEGDEDTPEDDADNERTEDVKDGFDISDRV